ncbi:Uncharacterised protein [Mycobacterium tuberculosis]|nr:Uncharacterised protein [Mycobacterium tuberculosis]
MASPPTIGLLIGLVPGCPVTGLPPRVRRRLGVLRACCAVFWPSQSVSRRLPCDLRAGPTVPPAVAGMASSAYRCGELEYVSAGSGEPRPSAWSIMLQRGSSSQSTRVTATPVRPARPVRPMRWTYIFSSSGH